MDDMSSNEANFEMMRSAQKVPEVAYSRSWGSDRSSQKISSHLKKFEKSPMSWVDVVMRGDQDKVDFGSKNKLKPQELRTEQEEMYKRSSRGSMSCSDVQVIEGRM